GTTGEAFDIEVRGSGFHNGAAVSFGDQVAVGVAKAASQERLVLPITISAEAAVGPRTVTVTNPNEAPVPLVGAFTVVNRDEKDRISFLLATYTQMWKSIDTHILVVWQSIAAMLGAFAIFGLVDKLSVPLDLPCTMIVLVVGWLLSHVY